MTIFRRLMMGYVLCGFANKLEEKNEKRIF